MFMVFGIAYSYGAFLDDLRLEFGASRAIGAVFFSLTSLLYFGLGAISGPALDRFGPRRVLLVGAVALALGLVATARAGSLGLALVAYGLGVGIAVACAYVPMVALVGGWFEERRTLALGVAVSGIGLGTLTLPPATAALIEAIGWRDSYLVLASVGVVTLVGCAFLVAPAPLAEEAGGARLGEAVGDRGYRRLYLSAVLVSFALFVPVRAPPRLRGGRGHRPGARRRADRGGGDRERGRPPGARRDRRQRRAACGCSRPASRRWR